MSHLKFVKSFIINGTTFKTDATATPQVLNCFFWPLCNCIVFFHKADQMKTIRRQRMTVSYSSYCTTGKSRCNATLWNVYFVQVLGLVNHYHTLTSLLSQKSYNDIQVVKLQSWTNFFGTLAFILVQCTFFWLQMPPPPKFNVGNELVQFQPAHYFPPGNIELGEGGCKRTQNMW